MVGPQYFYFLTIALKEERSNSIKRFSVKNSFRTTSKSSIEFGQNSFSISDIIKLYIIKGKKFSPKKLQYLLLTYYKINFEYYTKLERDDYLSLAFLQKVYSDKVNEDIRTHHEISENNEAITFVKKYLINYPKKIKSYVIFLTQPHFFFDYFMNVILFPTANLIFKYIMKEDINLATVKFEIYNIIILFLECYNLFLTLLINMIDQHGNEMRIHIENFFTSVDKDIKVFISSRITIVASKLEEIKGAEFEFFNLKNLLTIYSESILNISYIDSIKCSPKIQKKEIDDIFDPFYLNLKNQIQIYSDLKRNFESKEMLLFHIFDSDEKAIKNSICLCISLLNFISLSEVFLLINLSLS